MTNQYRILLVEDNPGDARLIQAGLRDSGLAVALELAESLAHARQKLLKDGFDVVLLDLSLPDSAGLETVARMHKAAPTMPIIVLTGLEDERAGIEAVRQGAQDYLVKGQTDHRLLSRAIQYAAERKKQAEIVRLQLDNLTRILDSMEDGVYISDHNYDLQYVNPTLVREFGPFEGRKCYEYFNDRKDSCPWCQNPEVFQTGQSIRWEWTSPKNGKIYDLIGTVIHNPDGSRSKLEIFRDITARKVYEEHLQRDKIELEQRVQERTADLSRTVDILQNEVRARLEAEEQLLEYQKKLQSLASELVLAEERQRRHIAEGLHDHIGQLLAALRMKIELLERPKSQPIKPERLPPIRDLIDQVIKATRTLTFELSPPMLYTIGLTSALEWLANHIREQYGIDCTVSDDQAPKPMTEEVQVMLFQAVRELLNNVVKHAAARKARVEVIRVNQHVEIWVRDDGIGFEPETVMPHAGFGFFSVRERLNYLGGTLEIKSQRGEGTEIRLAAPLKVDNK